MNTSLPPISRALLESAARFCELRSQAFALKNAGIAIGRLHHIVSSMSISTADNYMFKAKRLYFENEIIDDLELGFEAIDEALGFMYLDLGGDAPSGENATLQQCFEAMLMYLDAHYDSQVTAYMLTLMILRDDAKGAFANKRELDQLSRVYSSYPHTWLAKAIREQYTDWDEMVQFCNRVHFFRANGHSDIDPLTGCDFWGEKVREEGPDDASL